MKVQVTVPEALIVQSHEELRNRLRGARQSKAMWTIKRYLIIGTVSAVAGIVTDGLNRVLSGTGADNRLMQVTSVPNPRPTHVREVR